MQQIITANEAQQFLALLRFTTTTEFMKYYFVVLACHYAALYGFDQGFQVTVHFPLSSAMD